MPMGAYCGSVESRVEPDASTTTTLSDPEISLQATVAVKKYAYVPRPNATVLPVSLAGAYKTPVWAPPTTRTVRPARVARKLQVIRKAAATPMKKSGLTLRALRTCGASDQKPSGIAGRSGAEGWT